MCTESLDLKPRLLEKRDLPLLVAWANNTALSRVPYIENFGTLEGAETWFADVSKSEYRKDFAIENGGKVCAFGGFSNINREEKTAHIYMFVYPSLMNLGVGIDAIKSVCSYGFMELKLYRIYTFITVSDIATRHTYQECGFYMDGPIPEVVNGAVYYSLEKRDWEEDYYPF